MDNIYDIKTKKKVQQPRADVYFDRNKQCLKRIEEKGTCDCELCKTKARMTSRLYDVTRYLFKEHEEKTGQVLVVADALEIAIALTLRIRNEILRQ